MVNGGGAGAATIAGAEEDALDVVLIFVGIWPLGTGLDGAVIVFPVGWLAALLSVDLEDGVADPEAGPCVICRDANGWAGGG